MFKAQIGGVMFDTELRVKKGDTTNVELCEAGTGTVLGQVSCTKKELPPLGLYEFYVDTTHEDSYLANQLVANGLAVLVKKKKHIREEVIYLVYRLLR